ncbi:MAG: hypothetical protein V3V30_09950 [Parvularculaceae bacterium]
MKKTMLLLSTLIFAFSLSSCGKKTPLKNPPKPDQQINAQM